MSMKSLIICGSRKFKQEIEKFAAELEAFGVLVYAPDFESDHSEWDKISKNYQHYVAMGLTYDHIQKMRMADVVFIYNKGGYSGVSVTLELGCAVALAKPVYALADDPEVCRHVLFQEVITSAVALAKKLS